MLGFALATWTFAAERQPLPALPVERGPVLPLGWSQVTLGWARIRSDQAPGAVRSTGSLALRYAPISGLELRARVPVVHQVVEDQGGGFGPGDPSLGLRVGLARDEVTNRSVALDLGWTAPLGAAPDGVPLDAGLARIDLGLIGSARWGPLLGTLRVAGVARMPSATRRGPIDAPEGVVAEPGLLVQVGPLFPWLDGAFDTWGGALDGRLGLGVQLTRGVALAGAIGRALGGETPLHPALPRGDSAAIWLEVGA